MEKRNVEVEIFGNTYTIKSELPEDKVKQVAAYVDMKMKEVSEKTKSVDSLRLAILTALNIAEECLRERNKREELLRQIEEKVERIDKFIALQMM